MSWRVHIMHCGQAITYGFEIIINFGSGDGLLPDRHQATASINLDLSPMGSSVIHIWAISLAVSRHCFSKRLKFYMFTDTVIFPRGQWVKGTWWLQEFCHCILWLHATYAQRVGGTCPTPSSETIGVCQCDLRHQPLLCMADWCFRCKVNKVQKLGITGSLYAETT